MTYSKYFLPQDKKIPIPITIAVIILLIIFIARFLGPSPLPSRASKKTVRELRIVNTTHNQTGIFWQTDDKETGWVIYGQNENSLNKVASDERDLEDKKNLFYNHFVLVKNLQPNAKYFYKIISNNELVESNDKKAFVFRTAGNQTSVLNLNPAYGKIINENGLAMENAVVSVTFANSFPLITLSKNSGEWLIPLNTIINKNSLKLQSVQPDDKVLIEIFSEDRQKSKIDTLLSQISPLPQTIIVGKDYNFLNKEGVLSLSTVKTAKINQIQIIYPKEDSIIPGSKPLIKGTAIPDNEVEVSIESAKNHSFKTKADKDGLWTILITDGLPAGSSKLLIKTKDENGKYVQLTRQFSIAKSGEQVLAAATPEATFTPTDVPTVIPSPTFVVSPLVTSAPTVELSPPTSGSNVVPFGIASVSLIILGLGVLLAF